jgi:hypothetical protein
MLTLSQQKSTLLILILTSSLSMFGCTKSKETKCVESQRMHFNDPDYVEVVSNLGLRGADEKSVFSDSFWIRIKDKDTDGSSFERNMLCKPDGNEGYTRDKMGERIALLDAEIKLKKAYLEGKRPPHDSSVTKGMSSKAMDLYYDLKLKNNNLAIEDESLDIVYTWVDDLYSAEDK